MRDKPDIFLVIYIYGRFCPRFVVHYRKLSVHFINGFKIYFVWVETQMFCSDLTVGSNGSYLVPQTRSFVR